MDYLTPYELKQRKKIEEKRVEALRKEFELEKVREYKIAKSNLLVRSRFHLSLQEARLINYILSRITPDESLHEPKTFYIKDYCEVCGIDIAGSNYANVKKAIKGLADKSIFIKNPEDGETLIRWLDSVKLYEKQGLVTYTFFKEIIPYLDNLQQHFTLYRLYYTLPMTSVYSYRLYELCKSYQSMGDFTISIEDLKKQLELGNVKSYNTFANLKARVIDKAIDEINDYTDLIVIHRYIKKPRGKGYSDIEFVIKEKDTQPLFSLPKKSVRKSKKQNPEEKQAINSDIEFHNTDKKGEMNDVE